MKSKQTLTDSWIVGNVSKLRNTGGKSVMHSTSIAGARTKWAFVSTLLYLGRPCLPPLIAVMSLICMFSRHSNCLPADQAPTLLSFALTGKPLKWKTQPYMNRMNNTYILRRSPWSRLIVWSLCMNKWNTRLHWIEPVGNHLMSCQGGRVYFWRIHRFSARLFQFLNDTIFTIWTSIYHHCKHHQPSTSRNNPWLD